MIGDSTVLAIVPARGGSERLPGKNLRLLAGRPLIAWTLAAASGSALIDRVVVSTDDPAIAAAAAAEGHAPPFVRPAGLSGSDAPVIDAIEHALQQIGGGWDYVVLLQPTSPLRLVDDIDQAIRLCDASGAPSVVGVSPLPKPSGFYGRLDDAGEWQAGAEGFDRAVVINGAVYVGRPERLLRDRTFLPPGARGYLMPAERGWDVDTAADFAVCEALWPFVINDRPKA